MTSTPNLDDSPVGPIGAAGTSAAGTSAASGPGAFDAHRPPSEELLADCVHCGFCLPSCPTYVLWGEEMDSPRGRIHLMSQVREGEPLTSEVAGHFDACLGCMACVTACPSGVKYDELITATRAQVERNTTRPPAQRFLRAAIFAVFPYPRRLRALRGPLRLHQRSGLSRLLRRTGVLQRVSPHLAAMEALAPPLGTAEPVAEVTRARGAKRGTVGLLLGCVQREFFPGVNAATVRVLSAEGFDVLAPPRQGCCGALSAHNGREPEAANFARRLIDEFEAAGVEHVVVNSAGCGSAMKEYAALLADDAAYAARAQSFEEKVRDVSEFLAQIEPVAPRHPLGVSVAYHDACHLGHAQGIRSQPRQLLGAIPGLELHEVPDGSLCCGSAGIYNLLNPDTGRELGDLKAANVQRTGAELLVTANPGCLMQIHAALERAGTPLRLAHTVEVLDASIRGRRPAELGVLGAPTPSRRTGRSATT